MHQHRHVAGQALDDGKAKAGLVDGGGQGGHWRPRAHLLQGTHSLGKNSNFVVQDRCVGLRVQNATSAGFSSLCFVEPTNL